MPTAHPCTTQAPRCAARPGSAAPVHGFPGTLPQSLPATRFRTRLSPRLSALLPALLLGCLAQAAPVAALAPVRDALAAGYLGLHEAGTFKPADGRCADCPVSPQALFYFRDETIAVPARGAPPGTRPSHDNVRDDIGRWIGTPDAGAAGPPFLLWLAAPHIATGATLSADGNSLTFADGTTAAFATVPRIPTNHAFYDASTIRHVAGRPLRLRGDAMQAPDGTQRFVARTLWPEDHRIAPAGLPVAALPAGQSLATLIAADGGGATADFSSRLLWRREGAEPDPERRAVMALVLNGAQGDDDEAHGGHFAVATGWLQRDGAWGDWVVNNFYNLANHSEKGIVAAMLPMDNYLGDLNSGQSWYRPSYVLVATLRTDAAAARFQGAIARVFDRLYRHHVNYDHAAANCAGLSMDTFAGLGWLPPTQGPTSVPKALAGFYYSTLTDGSIASGRRSYRYLTEEQTRLYPRVAFEALGHDLLALANGSRPPQTPYETVLAQEVESITFVRVPQYPSSRAFGREPVASFDEYMARVPADRKDWKIIPVEPWPFPDALRDLPPADDGLPDGVVGALAFSALVPVVVLPWAGWKRWRHRRRSARTP
jgi:hypothetical protein